MVKSRKEETLIDDLKTFDNLQVYMMMLNPAKCVFGARRQAFGFSGV